MPIPCPTIPRALSIRSDILWVTQDIDTPLILLDAGVSLVEMMRLAIEAEDFLVEEPAHAAGCDHADEDDSQVEGLLCAPDQLFAGGEFGPWDAAIVAGEGDGFAGCARASQLVMGSIASASEGGAAFEESVGAEFGSGY